MVFLAVDLEGIASGEKPTDSKELIQWEKVNKKMVLYVTMAVEEAYQYLVEDAGSASDAWSKLKSHFEQASMATRMNARLALYEVTHDPSLPITVYFHALESAKSTLSALGVQIDDTEFKDVLLMRLHPSYHSIRLSICAQTTEPNLTNIKALLTSSSPIVDASVKVEDSPHALAARSTNRRPRPSGSSPDPIDNQGFRWCDPTAVGVCHRCGRSGHTAARCMYDMPRQVKDWLMAQPSRRRSPSPPDRANSASTHHHSSGPLSSCPNCGTNIGLEHSRFGLSTDMALSAFQVEDFEDMELGGGSSRGSSSGGGSHQEAMRVLDAQIALLPRI